MNDEDYAKERDRIEQVRGGTSFKKKEPMGVSPLYVRLPTRQVDWVKSEAIAQNRTLTAVLNILIDDAQQGNQFETYQ